jgi:catechol 2,3-dioxygenase-like lactoylglutathione lyase family enzyme
MRGCILFAAGLVVGLAVQTGMAQSLSPNRGLVGLNHVAVTVPDLPKAVEYYTKTLGFPEAFRSLDDKGQPRLVYVQISQGTFVELQPGNPQMPAAIGHLGIHVENMKQVHDMFGQRGANLSEIRTSPTKAVLSNITDLNGIRIELAELGPESDHRKAMNRWK